MRDTKIADELIGNILQISYQGLSSKLKKVKSRLEKIMTSSLHHQDVGALHQRFFDECFKRLDNLQLPTEREEPVVVTTPSKTGPNVMDMYVKLKNIFTLPSVCSISVSSEV